MRSIGVAIVALQFLIILASGQTAFSKENSTLWGKWRFIGYIYGGSFQEPANPNLILTFEFLQDGTDVLHWHRLNENGFCERKGKYSYEREKLIDEVIWVNPNNSFECYRDPDMVLGKKQITPLRRQSDRLYMDLPLADETLTYVWSLEPASTGSRRSR